MFNELWEGRGGIEKPGRKCEDRGRGRKEEEKKNKRKIQK